MLSDQGVPQDVRNHLEKDSKTLAATYNIHLTAICACAIQLGIADRLAAKGITPDWVMGCSLGDLARSVYCGLVDFQNVVAVQLQLFESYQHLGCDYEGINLGLRSPVQEPFSVADFDWFEEQGILPSRMAPRFLQMSVNSSQFKKLDAHAKKRNWSLRRAEFDVLLHADQLESLSNQAMLGLQGAEVHEPTTKIYSSILDKPLYHLEEIVDEAKQILWKPLQWQSAILSLQRDFGVDSFVNVGPCKSLSALQRQISPSCRASEAIELI